LREFTDDDVHLAFELGNDPYIPFIGSLPAAHTAQQALEWIHRQRGRLDEGKGLSFAIADAESDNAVGAIGLWLKTCRPAARRSATRLLARTGATGSPAAALKALTGFAWTIPTVRRIEL